MKRTAFVFPAKAFFSVRISSERYALKAAMQGIYRRRNTRKETADLTVNIDPIPAEPVSTSSVEITTSFALKPAISAEAALQSPKPRGVNKGAAALPIYERRLTVLSSVKLKWVSKLW